MTFSIRHEQIREDSLTIDVLRCEGEIDVATSPQIMDRVFILLTDPGVQIIELNLEGVRFLDSTGLDALMTLRKRAYSKKGKGTFRISIGKHKHFLRRIFAGLEKYFLFDDPSTGRFPDEVAT